LALPFGVNFLYRGPQDGRYDDLLGYFSDPANYVSSDVAYNIDTAITSSMSDAVKAAVASLTAFLLLGTLSLLL